MSLWKDGDQRLPRRGRPARARALRDRLPLHRRPQDARARLQRPDGADRQLVQAPEARDDRRAARPGRRSGSRYGYNNRTQMLRIPGAGADRGPDDRRLLQPLPGSRRRARRRPRRDRERARCRASRTPRTCTRSPTTSSRARGLETLPANLLEATHELRQDDVLREALGRGRDEDYVDYFIRVKREEWDRYHEQVTPWEIKEYLTRF